MLVCDLYINNSDRRALNKTLTHLGTSKLIRIKEDTSIEEPTFICTYNPKTLDLRANYIHVTQASSNLDYWYFINDKIMGTGNTLELVCESDPLQITKAQLQEIPLLIERQEFNYNNEIDDPLVITQANNQLTITSQIGSLSDTARYYLTVTGSSATTSAS